MPSTCTRPLLQEPPLPHVHTPQAHLQQYPVLPLSRRRHVLPLEHLLNLFNGTHSVSHVVHYQTQHAVVR